MTMDFVKSATQYSAERLYTGNRQLKYQPEIFNKKMSDINLNKVSLNKEGNSF
jgi:hypothetical protein